jgi:hypothetical protein
MVINQTHLCLAILANIVHLHQRATSHTRLIRALGCAHVGGTRRLNSTKQLSKLGGATKKKEKRKKKEQGL